MNSRHLIYPFWSITPRAARALRTPFLFLAPLVVCLVALALALAADAMTLVALLFIPTAATFAGYLISAARVSRHERVLRRRALAVRRIQEGVR